MNRRFFHRVDVRANGELLWATKSRLGKIKSHREYITTSNVSVSGARITVPGDNTFPVRSRARLKLGLEYCEVEILEVSKPNKNLSELRLAFITPSARFISIVEQWMPISTDERETYQSAWT